MYIRGVSIFLNTAMVRRTKADAEATRTALLDAAEQLFQANGVSRTSLQEIASAAARFAGRPQPPRWRRLVAILGVLSLVTLAALWIARAQPVAASGKVTVTTDARQAAWSERARSEGVAYEHVIDHYLAEYQAGATSSQSLSNLEMSVIRIISQQSEITQPVSCHCRRWQLL